MILPHVVAEGHGQGEHKGACVHHTRSSVHHVDNSKDDCEEGQHQSVTVDWVGGKQLNMLKTVNMCAH